MKQQVKKPPVTGNMCYVAQVTLYLVLDLESDFMKRKITLLVHIGEGGTCLEAKMFVPETSAEQRSISRNSVESKNLNSYIEFCVRVIFGNCPDAQQS